MKYAKTKKKLKTHLLKSILVLLLVGSLSACAKIQNKVSDHNLNIETTTESPIQLDTALNSNLESIAPITVPDLEQAISSDTEPSVEPDTTAMIQPTMESDIETSADAGIKTFSIFSANEDVTDFIITETELQLTPEALFDALRVENSFLLDDSIKILNFTIEGNTQETLLVLDLSEEFLDVFQKVGTSSEYLLSGSICNTFLKAYDADQIRLTVNGKSFESGHVVYDDYMGWHR